ncbi:MAG: Single-stranded DNA-binding protein [Syntrophorhabdus sp. PtaU1.Bin002]|nr:MAG: Single-stranded DNA-binding protein [Syntrophorhabdus sp. PtaB.Bin006]OPY70446.1 MAG: Single-stranded DNA-binding protein [Syntrophorhabdus sp. PtaU1.Bin002]
MSSLNKAIIIGRLGADPELRHTADGIPVATFNVATTETRRDRNGTKQDKTEWHRIVAWRKLGEIAAEYLKKGRLVYIEGKIQSREFEGRDGVKRRTFEIVASEMKMLGGGGQGEREDRRAQGGSPLGTDDDFIPEVEEDDVPL